MMTICWSIAMFTTSFFMQDYLFVYRSQRLKQTCIATCISHWPLQAQRTPVSRRQQNLRLLMALQTVPSHQLLILK